MPQPIASQAITYRQAKRNVERKLGFFTHFATYVLVMSGLVLLNLFTSPHYFWAKWPILGWGIGLLCNAIGVFLQMPAGDWKQRMIARELEKHQSPPA